MICDQIKKWRLGVCVSIVISVIVWSPSVSRAFIYTVKSEVNLRTGPGIGFPVITTLPHNRSLTLSKRINDWIKVITPSGVTGFVRNDMISDHWIKIHKKERRLYLMKGRDKVIKQYPIALSGTNPLSDKSVIGDGGTPEGRFFICEMVEHPAKSKYGARSLRISYPNIEDARRGLKDKIITMDQYRSIVQSVYQGIMPDQTTALGGSIRIHGGGSDHDWTLGCVALDDTDIKDVFDLTRLGFRVEIYASSDHDQSANTEDYMNKLILQGAKHQLESPALYTYHATQMLRLTYPGGDIAKNEAVCTDIVIRSLRYAGIDLQALVHEDATLNPQAYVPDIQKASYHIDHRRVRTLKRYFDRYCTNLSASPEKVRPGDIVIMDTGIQNGTQCDHIGIVSDVRDSNGNYCVINIWCVGEKTDTLSLIGRPYPDIAYYYRINHPYDYGAVSFLL